MFKRIMRVVLSKTFAFALLALLQIGLFLVLTHLFASTGVTAYTIITIISALVLVAVFEQDELNPAYKLMWVLIIILMPISGTVFYLLWGHRTVPRRKRKRLQLIDQRYNHAARQDPTVMEALEQRSTRLRHSAQYLLNHAYSPVYPNTGVEYYPIGRVFYPRFMEVLQNAKKFIFMEYYIWDEGTMLDEIVTLLCQKAAEGLDVRVLWDGFGSLFTLPRGFVKKLEQCGVRCCAFSPLELTIHVSDYAMLNHRDHRKITIVDGDIAFSGGLNIADEYINIKPRFGEWKDNSFLVRGEAAFGLTSIFLRNWDFASGDDSDPELYRPVPQAPSLAPTSFVQPYWDSPLDGENVSENAYLNIIRHATSYVYICTPYLILDHEMITNLTLAAKSGVDVRILTPGIPDKPTVFLVTQSYYPVLLREGVRIFEYTPGFNHAKMYVSDDKVAIVGSANMDYRSLYLHFENCVSFYGGQVVDEAKADMLECFEKAREITLADTKNITWHRRIVQIIAKFFAPML